MPLFDTLCWLYFVVQEPSGDEAAERLELGLCRESAEHGRAPAAPGTHQAARHHGNSFITLFCRLSVSFFLFCHKFVRDFQIQQEVDTPFH